MALATYLLATLYKALFSFFHKEISGNCGGPFWLLQAWLYAYFPKARPLLANTVKPIFYSYAEQLLTYNSQPILTFRNQLTMFYNLPSKRPSNLYMPFQNFEFSSSRLRFLFVDPSDLHNEQAQEQNETWRHILTSRHVLVGCSISSAKMSNCSFETYCPNQWARQLGLSQGIPYPYFHPTIHEEIGSRIFFKDPTQTESILTESTKLFQDFGPFFFKPAADCLTAFDHWWGLMSAIIFCKPLETCLHDTCIHNQGPISSPSKLKAAAKIGPAAEPLVRDQHKGKAPMDATTQTNTPSVPKLMADSFAAAQTQAQRGTTTCTPAETEVAAKKREEPSTAPSLSTDLSDWDIPLSQMVGQTTSNPSGQLYQKKRRRLLLIAADDEDPSTSPQHIHPIPSPINNVPREPTVQPTPPPPEASQQTSLQPASQSSPQQSTQSASQHPSTSPQHIVPFVFSPQPSPSNPFNSQTSNKELERIEFDISINSQSSPTDDNTKSPEPEVHNNQGMDIIHDSSPHPMSETELEGPHHFPLLEEPEKEPEGTDAAISSVPETTPPTATTAAEQGQPSARTLSGQAIGPCQDIWAELSILQQHLDEISPLPQRLHLFHAETQQTLTTFMNLINTPVEEIILRKPEETLACLTTVLNLYPNPFNPIQLKQLAKIITEWPTLSEMVWTCSKDIQTKKDFLNEAHTISTSLKLSQQTSAAIIEQHSALELEETKLMAELASVRQRKAHLQQQHDQLNQEARMMLSQITHRSASIQTTKAELDQAQAMLADAQSEWSFLAILFPKS
ncbi:hypothetical protein CsSME_00022841 [Camellia sinensis var. sinensis]